MPLQPLLHDLLAVMMAPTQAWSAPDGQIRPIGAQGVYHADLRIMSEAILTVDGAEPETVASGQVTPGVAEIVALPRRSDDPGADPTLRLVRTRRVAPGAVSESIRVESATRAPVDLALAVRLASDLADVRIVKGGGTGTAVAAEAAGGDGLRWTRGPIVVTVAAAAGATVDLTDPVAPTMRWSVTARPGEPLTVGWTLSVTRPDAVIGSPSATASAAWPDVVVTADDRRLSALVRQSLDDLATLRMSTSSDPDDVFLAAGAPWYLTLFGRDSIWSARMLLPLGTELAAGTLRTLAARQGTRLDPVTGEQPGKILHELRGALPDAGGREAHLLPPEYYGTVDATALWVCLLHDAWRWGMPSAEVEPLLPAMERALAWMATHGDADGDGFLEYHDPDGRGLANQGWKDSDDAVQWRDGTLAVGPIALAEVQGYAHEAARSGASLLDAFGRPGGDRWREWAAGLADRFRSSFWVGAGDDSYPAIALDAAKRPVNTVTSNIGHLLGTGLLDTDEEARVARRLASAELDSGYGLRTLATDAAGYWPLRYHGGSVWPHDTAIVISGLARSGHHDVAARFAAGVLAAAADLDYRLPELYSGDARGTMPAVVPYPAACRPQAWSAASAMVLVTAILGLQPDVPAGTLQVAPMAESPVGAIRATGLRVGGGSLAVEVDATGVVRHVTTDAGLEIVD